MGLRRWRRGASVCRDAEPDMETQRVMECRADYVRYAFHLSPCCCVCPPPLHPPVTTHTLCKHGTTISWLHLIHHLFPCYVGHCRYSWRPDYPVRPRSCVSPHQTLHPAGRQTRPGNSHSDFLRHLTPRRRSSWLCVYVQTRAHVSGILQSSLHCPPAVCVCARARVCVRGTHGCLSALVHSHF